MSTKKKPIKKSVKKTASKQTGKTTWQAVKPWLVARKTTMVARVRKYLARRPHRSFRLTRRRDYKRSFKMPGYWAFTNHVRKTLWNNRKLFGGMVLVYIVAIIVIGGFGAQDTYIALNQALKDSSGDLFQGNFGTVGQAGLLLVATITQGLTPSITEAQSIFGGLALFFVWLATIWLLRNVLAGHKPKLRDALYNSGSPVLATVLVSFIILVQLIPAAIALIAYDAARVSGLADSGIPAMLALIGVVLVATVSAYWLVSSVIALIIVTLPGMYPISAMRAAGDMVIGRRMRVLYRLLWLGFVVVITWALIVIPVILFDDWLKGVASSVNWLPLVPLVVFGLGSVTVVFATSYIYLLYRRIVDDDAPPA